MAKKGKQAGKASKRSNPKRGWLVVLGLLVIGAAMAFYLVSSRESSADSKATSSGETDLATINPALKNRLVLPASPRNSRPFTLSPQSFSEPEVRQGYQVAKDIPEVLEHMSCYCGCYSSSGHRNNLDCFADNHGAT